MRGTHSCLWWLVAVITSTSTKEVSAEQFTFEFFTDNTCTTIKSGPSGGGSWTFESDQCNAWTSSIPNSMKVLSCSSKCICFAQSPNSSSCGDATNSNVKESCSNTCEMDNQGSWLQIRDFEGCDASLQVDDSEYSCPCTNMSPNSVCTTDSDDNSDGPTSFPILNPTSEPNSSPISMPTSKPSVYSPSLPTSGPNYNPSGDSPTTRPSTRSCEDSSLRMKIVINGEKKRRYCDWAARRETESRCNIPTVASHCPIACANYGGNCNIDSEARFKTEKPDGNTIMRYCDPWVINNASYRCTFPGVQNTCRSTCS